MSYANRMLQLPATRIKQLVAFPIVAALSFTLGVTAHTIRDRLGATTTDIKAVALAPAVTELYDGGLAGGPEQMPNTGIRGVSTGTILLMLSLFCVAWGGAVRRSSRLKR